MNHIFVRVPIVTVKGNDYGFRFWYMSKDDAINIMNNSNLDEKKQEFYNFFHYIKK